MVRALPEDGFKYEVVHGELLVTPAPRAWHEVIVRRLLVALDAYLRDVPVGEVFGSRGDISWDTRTLVQPDVFVVRLDEARSLTWRSMRTLLLVAEVTSPRTARADRITKRRRYQEAGVPVYWVVDGDERAVHVWTPECELPAIEREELIWRPVGVERPFTLSLVELFRSL